MRLWTHIGAEFTQYLRLTPGEDILAILVYNLFVQLPIFLCSS